MTRRRGESEPEIGFCVILIDPLPVLVDQPHLVLRARHALVGGQSGQTDSLGDIARHAVPVKQQRGQIGARLGMALVGGALVALGGQAEIGRDALTVLVHYAEAPFGLDAAALGLDLEQPEGGGELAVLVGADRSGDVGAGGRGGEAEEKGERNCRGETEHGPKDAESRARLASPNLIWPSRPRVVTQARSAEAATAARRSCGAPA